MLKAGDLAPDFEATLESSEKVSLNQYKGRKVVLYFYPRDNTSGCTREACDFRDRISDIQARGSVVLGVSPDSVKSHQRFKEKFDLPFSLVSDESREVAQAYGVWREKKLYGKTSMGIVRSTFIIDEEGRIARVYDKVKVAGHVDDVLESL
ncbi:MAG: thioredoxin-dependent thiol peroxidase [Chloroflexi bacterium]|nr:thioredoxin-dependent thiol peroxidase [Chloroflexota bacterium]